MVRDLSSLEELNHIEMGEANNWEISKPTNIKTLEECLNIVKKLDPILCEGYVVVDRNFKRYKIKSPQFENIANLKVNRDNTEERQKSIERDNFRRLCEIVRTNEHQSFIKLPKYTSVYNQYIRIQKSYDKLLNDTYNFVGKINGLHGKDLGMFMKGQEKYLNTLAFGISQGRIDLNNDNYLEDYFYDMNIKTFEEIIRKLK